MNYMHSYRDSSYGSTAQARCGLLVGMVVGVCVARNGGVSGGALCSDLLSTLSDGTLHPDVLDKMLQTSLSLT
jgi:hypothetical protein